MKKNRLFYFEACRIVTCRNINMLILILLYIKDEMKPLLFCKF